MNEYCNIDNIEIVLPPHYRCASHTCNRIAVKDSEAALTNKRYKTLSNSVFNKCRRLWKNRIKSTQCADQIKEILGVYLQTPNVTRYNQQVHKIYLNNLKT